MSTPELEYVACPTANCGGQWLPESKVRQLRENHETFYCPSGHSQWFSGKSETEKLKAEIERLKKDRLWWIDHCENLQKELKKYRRSKIALHAVITRMKKSA